jgi:hypothetical protein
MFLVVATRYRVVVSLYLSVGFQYYLIMFSISLVAVANGYATA